MSVPFMVNVWVPERGPCGWAASGSSSGIGRAPLAELSKSLFLLRAWTPFREKLAPSFLPPLPRLLPRPLPRPLPFAFAFGLPGAPTAFACPLGRPGLDWADGSRRVPIKRIVTGLLWVPGQGVSKLAWPDQVTILNCFSAHG